MFEKTVQEIISDLKEQQKIASATASTNVEEGAHKDESGTDIAAKIKDVLKEEKEDTSSSSGSTSSGSASESKSSSSSCSTSKTSGDENALEEALRLASEEDKILAKKAEMIGAAIREGFEKKSAQIEALKEAMSSYEDLSDESEEEEVNLIKNASEEDIEMFIAGYNDYLDKVAEEEEGFEMDKEAEEAFMMGKIDGYINATVENEELLKNASDIIEEDKEAAEAFIAGYENGKIEKLAEATIDNEDLAKEAAENIANDPEAADAFALGVAETYLNNSTEEDINIASEVLETDKEAQESFAAGYAEKVAEVKEEIIVSDVENTLSDPEAIKVAEDVINRDEEANSAFNAGYSDGVTLKIAGDEDYATLLVKHATANGVELPESVSDGIVLAAQNSEKVAEAIREAIESDPVYLKVAKAGAETAAGNYDEAINLLDEAYKEASLRGESEKAEAILKEANTVGELAAVEMAGEIFKSASEVAYDLATSEE